MVEVLRAHRVRRAAHRLVAGAAWTDLDIVVCTGTGALIDPTNARKALQKAAQRAKVGKVTPYTLRHTCASWMSERGARLEMIGDVLGHDPRITQVIYRHSVTPTVRGTAEVLEDIWEAM